MSNDPFDDDLDDSIPELSDCDLDATQSLSDLSEAAPASESSLQPILNIGPYKILDKIAEGGMGAVYRAEQQVPIRRIVALKVIKAGVDSGQVVARFEAERQALAMMDHPGIAKIFDAGTTDKGAPYFVMELVNGAPLTEHCDNHELSIPDRLALFVAVCKAVAHAHARGIVHRDLKPSNVLVAVHDGVAIPKVIDFGLAKATDHRTTLTDKTMFTEFGQIVGTLQYMSPEQAEMSTQEIDARTDVYSLGVILYELLAGSTPLEREAMQQAALLQVLEMIRELEPPRPSTRLTQSGDSLRSVSQLRQSVPAQLTHILRGELDWVVMRAIEKEPSRRYLSAEDFADDVTRYLRDETVVAKPPSLAYRARKFAKRHRTGVFVGCAACLAIVAIAALTPVFFRLQHDATVARLEQTLEQRISDIDLTEDAWRKSTTLVQQLSDAAPEQGILAEQRLINAAIAALSTSIGRPRLTKRDRTEAAASIARIQERGTAPQQAERLAALESELRQRSGGWNFVAATTPGVPLSTAALFAPGRLLAGTDPPELATEFVAPADAFRAKGSEYFAPLTLTNQICTGDTRVHVLFENWESSHSVGISLNVEDGLGYDFVVTTPNRESVIKPFQPALLKPLAAARELANLFLCEVRRGGTTLFRTEVPANKLPSGSLRMTAVRDGNMLSVQLNDLAPLSILDPFPLRSRDVGVIGLRGMPGVSIVSLRHETRPIVQGNSPLTLGDELVADGNLIGAIDQYERQLSLSSDDPELSQECQFKIAESQWKMERTAESNQMLQSLLSQPGETWPLLAAIHLWERAVSSDNTADADAAYAFLKASGKIAEAAKLATEETRSRIITPAMNSLALSEVLKPNPNRLETIRRATEVDRDLSQDGVGRMIVQISYAKALRLEGKNREASEFLKELWEHYQHPELLRRYIRALRFAGDPRESITAIDEARATNAHVDDWLLLSRAQTRVMLGEYVAAEKDIEEAFAACARIARTNGNIVARLHLMKGFLQERSGDHVQALVSWKRCYEILKSAEYPDHDAKNFESLFLIIAGGLSGELQPEDASGLVRTAVSSVGGSSLTELFPSQTIHECLLMMWRSEVGMKVASDFAFETIGLRDRILLPPTLAGYEFVIQNAFVGRATPAEREVVWAVAKHVFEEFTAGNGLSTAQLMQLAISWKGTTNIFGWSGVSATLPEKLRCRFAYLLGNRLITRGDIAAAKGLLRESAELKMFDPQTASLAEEVLKLLNAGTGNLQLSWNGPEPVDVLFERSDGYTQSVRIRDTAIVSLKPGEYSLPVIDGTVVSSDGDGPIQIRMGRSRTLDLQWRWSQSERESQLPGLLTHTAERTDGEAWQLVRTLNEHHTTDFAMNSTGDELARVGHDNVIRISKFGEVDAMRAFVHYPSALLTIDWSPDGTTLAAGNRGGNLFFVDPESGTKLLEIGGTTGAINCVRWSPDGRMLAVGEMDPTIRLFGPDGVEVGELEGHRNDIRRVAWSDDGASLVSAANDGVIVWDIASQTTRYKLPSLVDATSAVFSPDGLKIAVSTRTQTKIIDSRTGETLVDRLVGDDKYVQHLHWSRDGESICVAGWFYGAMLWSEGDGAPTLTPLEKLGNGPIRSHPTKDLMVVANLNGYQIYDSNWTDQGTNVSPTLVRVSSSRVNHDGTHLAAVASEGRICLQDLRQGISRAAVIASGYRILAWHPSRNVLAAGTEDGNLVFLDATGNELKRVALGPMGLNRIRWSRNGDFLFVTSLDSSLFRLDLDFSTAETAGESSVNVVGSPRLLSTDSPISMLAVDPAEDQVAIAQADNSIEILSSTDGTPIKQLAPLGWLNELEYSGSGRYLLAVGGLGVRSWNIAESWQARFDGVGTNRGIYFETVCPWGENHFALLSFHGVLHRYDPDQRTYESIRDFGEETLPPQVLANGSVWIHSNRGIVRELSPQGDEVNSVSVLNSIGNFVTFTKGGGIVGEPESLDRLSCIILNDGEQTVVPATSFYSDSAVGTE